jgi:hypothetical protein
VSEAAKYLNFSIDPWDSVGQCRYHFSFRDGIGILIDLEGTVHFFNFSVNQTGPERKQTIIRWTTAGVIGTPADLVAPVRYWDLSTGKSSKSCAIFGRYYAIWRGFRWISHRLRSGFTRRLIQAIPQGK